jgi:hypothetical protein
LLCSFALGHVRKYFQTSCVLAPFFLAPMSSHTTSTFIALHLELDRYFPLFFEDYKLNQDLWVF